ncbi:MAG: hypothetical protein A2W99_15260 [Bacteroidetes bacterium GWF2_33_16]|nr:MAG: hypothetical protein A2X00_09470 [Bacteroidetes bacterium GWE2_32_14]OFY07681.1 MAG: hypothetical protein A2W99_15260 [Bacteroidetes bacterium GWF2_33_16]
MRKIALFIFGLCFSTALISQTRKEVWIKDIEYLKTELAIQHKNLFFSESREYFNHQLDSIIKLIDKKDDTELAIALQIVVAKMGDDHTSVDYYKKVIEKGRLPLFTYWFTDGFLVTTTTADYQKILGFKLTAINGLSIDSVVYKTSALLTQTNEAIIKYRIPGVINLMGVLEYFEIADSDSVFCSFENNSGNTMDMWIKPIDGNNKNKDFAQLKSEKVPLGWLDQKSFFWSKILDDGKTLYVQYNQCRSKESELKYGNKKVAKELPSFDKFKKELLKQITQPEIERLVFDMRFNSGGSSPQGTELINELAQIEKINRKGKLFVLVGRRTFSSAIINTMDFKEKTNAIIVGEQTSGKPNHFGEVRYFALPNSGIRVYYSTKYFKRNELDENTIFPNHVIEMSSDDYLKGIDLVIDWTLNFN